MPAGNAYPSIHLVPFPFLGLAYAPVVETSFPELAMFFSTFHLEYPSVLSRFCLDVRPSGFFSRSIVSVVLSNRDIDAPLICDAVILLQHKVISLLFAEMQSEFPFGVWASKYTKYIDVMFHESANFGVL